MVFDDQNWDSFRNKKGWFGAQDELILTDKYAKKKHVKWGKPMIWLCNPEDYPLDFDTPWYQKNIVVIKLTNKLY